MIKAKVYNSTAHWMDIKINMAFTVIKVNSVWYASGSEITHFLFKII